jgi:hypothetical protein
MRARNAEALEVASVVIGNTTAIRTWNFGRRTRDDLAEWGCAHEVEERQAHNESDLEGDIALDGVQSRQWSGGEQQ